MSERTTPDPVASGQNLPHVVELDVGYLMSTRHTHTKLTADIIIVGADTDRPAYMGCFGREVGEPPGSIEERWNVFAETMWRYGVEPIQDDPWYTVVDEGVIWDHYTLREIRPDEDGSHD